MINEPIKVFVIVDKDGAIQWEGIGPTEAEAWDRFCRASRPRTSQEDPIYYMRDGFTAKRFHLQAEPHYSGSNLRGSARTPRIPEGRLPTDEEAAERMAEFAELDDSDPEAAHAAADDFINDIMVALGYVKTIQIRREKISRHCG